jgi:hypothetical protein
MKSNISYLENTYKKRILQEQRLTVLGPLLQETSGYNILSSQITKNHIPKNAVELAFEIDIAPMYEEVVIAGDFIDKNLNDVGNVQVEFPPKTISKDTYNKIRNNHYGSEPYKKGLQQAAIELKKKLSDIPIKTTIKVHDTQYSVEL